MDHIELPATADFHSHLREGDMMELVVPTIRQGGANLVYVMPNLDPPITTVAHALDYKKRLMAIEPNVDFLMTLYLHPSITPEVIREASEAGITGVKCYPHGLTTNSSSGVVDYESFWPVFREMEQVEMVLNLHGEAPSGGDVTILSAEEEFLPTLRRIHSAFPKLRIVLEHVTTRAAVATVVSAGPTVAATITAHHLHLIVDDWANDPFNYCKPVAKLPDDRAALVQAVFSDSPKFFLGTDSAPHPRWAKQGARSEPSKTAAGVFTQPYTTQLVFMILKEYYLASQHPSMPWDWFVRCLADFTSVNGRRFYRIPDTRGERIQLRDDAHSLTPSTVLTRPPDLQVVPFRYGESMPGLKWIDS